MARKVVNRKALRELMDAAEREGMETTPSKSKAPSRKAKGKAPTEVRLKAYWGVFNQAMKRVALFEFHQKKQANEKAEALTASTKTPHFVRVVKEEIVES